MAMDKIGTVIQLDKDQRECLESVNKQKEAAWIGFILATQAYKKAEEDIIELIRAIMPELEEFEFSVNHQEGRIKILGKRHGRHS